MLSMSSQGCLDQAIHRCYDLVKAQVLVYLLVPFGQHYIPLSMYIAFAWAVKVTGQLWNCDCDLADARLHLLERGGVSILVV